MRRPFTVPALLAVGGLVWAGVHVFAHRVSAGGGAHPGHADTADRAAYLSTSLTLCLSLAIVLAAATSILPAWRGTSTRSFWLFAVVPLLGLFGGALLDSESTPTGVGANVVGLVPVALLVVVVQVAVALSVVRIARRLLDLLEGAARGLAGPTTVPAAARARRIRLLHSERRLAGRLALSGGPRAPPAPSAAV